MPTYTTKGTVDSDQFGHSLCVHASPRRTSSSRPIRADIARPRKTRSGPTLSETVVTFLTGEPCEIQARRGSFNQREQGLDVSRFFTGYFYPASGIRTGDRVVTATETLLVTYVTQKGPNLEADLEALPTS